MKKVKVNVDKEAIRLFLIEHVEKIVFGVAAVCFVLIVYKAFARGAFDQTPEKLSASVERAKRHIEQTEPGAETPDPPKVDRPPTEEGPYKHDTGWNRPLFPKVKGPREWPPFLNVEGLRGVAGIGAFELNPQLQAPPPDADSAAPAARSSGRRNQGQRWIVLTAKIPYREQVREYAECFARAMKRDSQKDVPTYIYYRVERAEVTDVSGTGNLQWKPFSILSELKFKQRWATTSEVVDGKYLIEKGPYLDPFAFPLGPLVVNDNPGMARSRSPWATNESVAHPPDIPLMTQEPKTDPEAGRRPDQRTAPVVDPLLDGPMVPVETRTDNGTKAKDNQEPAYKLFRFFDFTVESGKSYVYRVRLILQNPNYGFEDRFLAEEVRAAKKAIYDEAAQKAAGNAALERRYQAKWEWVESNRWTPPCQPVYVQRDSRLLAVGVKPPPPSHPADHPTCKLLAVTWVKSHGLTAFQEFGADRGKVLNFPECTFPPSGHAVADGQERISVDYITEATVLDMRASRLSNKETGPGDILLMDGSGALVIRNEMADRPQCDKCTAVSVASPREPPPRQNSQKPGGAAKIDLEPNRDEFDFDG